MFDSSKGYLEYYLATELTKLDCDVYVVDLKKASQFDIERHNEGFHTIRIPCYIILGGYRIPTLKGVANIIRFVRKVRPEVIHCQPLFTPLSLVLILSQLLFGGRIVGSLVTGGPIVTRFGLFNPSSLRTMLRFILAKFIVDVCINRRIDLYFALSNKVKRMLLRHFEIPEAKVAVIPLGADSSLFRFISDKRNRIRYQLGLSDKDLVVTFTGRIEPSKEVDLLIRSIAPVMHKNSHVRLLILGSGSQSYIDYLGYLCSNQNISHKVIFHPSVHRTQLPGFYCATDIAVWPGSPSISIIEAAAVGLPLIIKRSPFTEYLLSYGNGYSIVPRNVNDLSGKLDVLVRDSNQRIQMGCRSRQMVENELNWVSIANRYHREYHHLFANV